MSAMLNGPGVVVTNNIYTVVLGLALAVVVASAAYVAFKCYMDYNTLFAIVAP